MSQKLITATKEEAQTDELSLEEKLQSTEWRFAEAYIEENFNLAAAARKVFNVGGKGAKESNLVSSASEMGRQTLKKLETQQYVKEILLSRYTSPEKILMTFGEILQNKEYNVDSRINLGWRLLEEQGVVLPQKETTQDHRHIHLVLPQRKED